ncbi:MAG: ComEC/Rec2 family competence protein, partial [Muribaculaceae bacterium]|nr:ComEC/Rec2 family competence protein [Muribaculaceae bacterium]
MYKGPLIPALTLALGIFISSVSQMVWWIGILPIIIGSTLYFFLLRKSSDPIITYRMAKWHILWVMLIFVGIGMIDEGLSRPLTLEKVYSGKVPEKVTCEVTGILSKTYGDRIDVIIEGTNHAKARLRSGVTTLSPGDIISVPTKYLIEVSTDTTEIGKKIGPMLISSGILYGGMVFPSQIERIGYSKSIKYFFIRLRENIEINIERSHLKKETSDFLKAILMGDKNGLDEHTKLTFANGGTAHMLALSGLHLGILATLILLILWPIKLIGKYKWGYGAAIILLWIYVIITGMSHSSVRACIMTTIAFIAIITERKNYAGNALCSACILILLFDPMALFDAGFQLSVVCVGALIAFASTLNPIGHRHHPILYYICGSLIATMVATAASWVLTSYYFSQIPLMFLPTNILLLPLLPVYLGIAVVFIIF